MPKTVILGAARTPIGKLGGGLCLPRRHRARRHRDQGRARARRRRARRGRARRHGPGPAGRPGPDPLAPGADQGRASRRRSPPRRSTRSAPRACARRCILDRRSAPATSRSASAAAWSRCPRRPYLLPEGPLRLPHGRRQGARRDGPRRPDQPVQRPPDVRRGHRGRRRARDHPPRPRPLGAALARARASGRDRRGPPARGDRPR